MVAVAAQALSQAVAVNAAAASHLRAVGGNDVAAFAAAIQNCHYGANAGMMIPAYQQQLTQMAMMNQFHNYLNNQNLDSTLQSGNLNGTLNAGNINLNEFGNDGRSPIDQEAAREPQQRKRPCRSQQTQEHSLNTQKPLGSQPDTPIERATSADSSSISGQSKGGKTADPNREMANYRANCAQRIGLSNSSVSSRRPNERLGSPDVAAVQQLGFKNSMTSEESLALEYVDSTDSGGRNTDGPVQVVKSESSKGEGNKKPGDTSEWV